MVSLLAHFLRMVPERFDYILHRVRFGLVGSADRLIFGAVHAQVVAVWPLIHANVLQTSARGCWGHGNVVVVMKGFLLLRRELVSRLGIARVVNCRLHSIFI